MDISQNIELFQELVRCGGEISLWRYDGEGNLLSSNCPEEAVFAAAFSLSGCRERMLAHAVTQDEPVLLGSGLGLVWGAAFEKREGRLYRAYVLGPVFFSDVAVQQIKNGLAQYDGETAIAWKIRFIQNIKQVPTAQHILFSRYLLMLHYCLTREHLDASALSIQNQPQPPKLSPPGEGRVFRDRYMVWSAERSLLHMVRTGDLNYKSAFTNSAMLSNGVPLKDGAPMRQEKNSVIVFCSIVCRAAIEGGLSPEEAYSLGDFYIQSAENAKTMDELSAIPAPMYDDFIRRVHRCRTNPKLSPAVQKCCDYIEMNLTEKVRASDLAALAGYSEYYITRKFKEETGHFINDYVKFAKIERAKVLLQNTDLSVLEIAEQLGFTTRSYFGRSFREVAGMSPTEFREQCARPD